MLTKLEIENFKSIHKESIELGRVNVFIGENGCGKTNILEGLGMASALQENKLSNDELALKGIRVTKPSITINSFKGQKIKKEVIINLDLKKRHNGRIFNLSTRLETIKPNEINSKWKYRQGIRSQGEDEYHFFDEIERLYTSTNKDLLIYKKVNESRKTLTEQVSILLEDHNRIMAKMDKKLKKAVDVFDIDDEEIKKIRKTEKILKKLIDSYEIDEEVKKIKKAEEQIKEREEILKEFSYFKNVKNANTAIGLNEFKIFNLSTKTLRGIGGTSHAIPGINGENLDYLINSFSKEEREELEQYASMIKWLDEIIIDKEDALKLQGHKLNLSSSKLYFRDKFMQKKNNVFSAENANEGILHVLFYIALFISKDTPKLFAIDNIETALNPGLCRSLIEVLIKLAKKHDKQVLITTHNPAILDGINLHDDEQRIFTVSRNFKGHTKVKRLQIKPDKEVGGHKLKLSELWMRNYLGAIPQHY